MVAQNIKELSALRDQMLERRALQQQCKAASDKAKETLREEINNLKENYEEELLHVGVDISVLSNLDYERLSTDADYLADMKERISELSSLFQHKLEAILNVQN